MAVLAVPGVPSGPPTVCQLPLRLVSRHGIQWFQVPISGRNTRPVLVSRSRGWAHPSWCGVHEHVAGRTLKLEAMFTVPLSPALVLWNLMVSAVFLPE